MFSVRAALIDEYSIAKLSDKSSTNDHVSTFPRWICVWVENARYWSRKRVTWCQAWRNDALMMDLVQLHTQKRAVAFLLSYRPYRHATA